MIEETNDYLLVVYSYPITRDTEQVYHFSASGEAVKRWIEEVKHD